MPGWERILLSGFFLLNDLGQYSAFEREELRRDLVTIIEEGSGTRIRS